ncbi:MAG: family 78 glycoside hydrolase catalytic domain [Clostridia bacterium]|nr:family 78 glycoside hydrolase catalytic domain [Clostridia bacterium]
MKIFEKAKFIKARGANKDNSEASPLFRKEFYYDGGAQSAEIAFCALGIGHIYLNGERITGDLFLSPLSDYDKRLWYNRYDVTEKLKRGTNVLSAELGNGFFNEGFHSVWKFEEAEWRRPPQFILSLLIDGEEKVFSDETFSCLKEGYTFYNQLRSGERADMRKYPVGYKGEGFDAAKWDRAEISSDPPKGEFSETDCDPIREIQRIKPVDIFKTDEGYLFDFGKNISGYAEISVCGKAGREITLSYAEDIDEDFKLKLNGLGVYYPEEPFQTDKVITREGATVWKPKFTYHGFRYCLVKGLTENPDESTLTAIEVHQDLKRTAKFTCSDPTLNAVYEAGINSSLSNAFYALTDCPTREKLGWTNDAQASAPQFLMNFDSKKLLTKWLEDIKDAFSDEGDLPGIVPSNGWGYGMGPVCNGIIFTLPYDLYRYTGDEKPLISSLSAMERYYSFFCSHRGTSSLGDWTGARNLPVPKEFIEDVYDEKFTAIFSEGYAMAGDGKRARYYAEKRAEIRADIEKKYISEGRSVYNEQTAVSALIVLGIGDEKALGEQLAEITENNGGHIACGMFGIRFLYDALSVSGRGDLALKVIVGPDPPSFGAWMKDGATSLWETFGSATTLSKNHHMYSNVLGYFIEYILGIKHEKDNYGVFEVSPDKTIPLKSFSGGIYRDDGAVSVEKGEDGSLTISASGNYCAKYSGEVITNGKRTFKWESTTLKK